MENSQFSNDLLSLLRGEQRNLWTRFGELSVYLRVGEKSINRKQVRCLQIANVSTPPQHQRRGTFTKMLELIKNTTDLPIYAENVNNHEFRDALIRRGFVAARSYDGVVTDVVLER